LTAIPIFFTSKNEFISVLKTKKTGFWRSQKMAGIH
jgi:hypothetical protein